MPEATTTKQKSSVKLPTGKYTYALGRRKESVARVRLYDGSGRVFVNDRELSDFFPRHDHQRTVLEPFDVLDDKEAYDVTVRVTGGGITGQAGAIRLGIARALVLLHPDTRTSLKKSGFLRRDPRMKERKKFGLRSARRAPQWSKR